MASQCVEQLVVLLFAPTLMAQTQAVARLDKHNNNIISIRPLEAGRLIGQPIVNK